MHMAHRLIASLLLLMALLGPGGSALAQSDELLEIDTGRTMKVDDNVVPVVHRAILTLPATPTDTALLFFRGDPGYMLIRSLNDKYPNMHWLAKNESDYLRAGIALVLVDCPTDQWGANRRPPATKCLFDYRSSTQHADDVRRILKRLKDDHGILHPYILGHSLGTVSSRWLSINLGKDEVAGIIHSATINSYAPAIYWLIGNLMRTFPANASGAPMLFVHHERDACPSTPHFMARNQAKDNLVTVRGGLPQGDVCGGQHYHSYGGREEAANKAIIAWIKDHRVEAFVGE